jgi:hypothetical protein
MKNKRSYPKLVLGFLAVALAIANCTVKEDTDESCEKGDKVNGCECPGGVTGHQICGSNGVFGSCQCPGGAGGSSNSSGGDGSDGAKGGEPSGGTSSGGTSSGGAGAGESAGGSAEGGMAGAGGESFAFDSCDECVDTLCSTELDACALAEDGLCETQYADIIGCIEDDRVNNNVTRDRLRGCGVTLGTSPDPDLVGAWAPQGMTPETTDLINCIATSSSVPSNGDWATVNEDNFPQSGPPKPWPADSCAKLACTKKL